MQSPTSPRAFQALLSSRNAWRAHENRRSERFSRPNGHLILSHQRLVPARCLGHLKHDEQTEAQQDANQEACYACESTIAFLSCKLYVQYHGQ